MCGICGIYTKKLPVGDSISYVKTMTEALYHRGPDDEGFLAVDTKSKRCFHLIGNDSKVEDKHIINFNEYADLFLGHRRLSIIDISPAGHQPMSNKDGSIWTVYNGEIYNYVELRQEIEESGVIFQTSSDTEVLIAAYELWGQDCLSKFNGMWAFVIYDKKKNIIFGSRDRFGVKPFYYYLKPECFAFASEIKALLKLPFVSRKINPIAFFDFLILECEINAEGGFFAQIQELPPSFAFRFDLSANTFEKWKYYNLAFLDKYENFEPDRALRYRERLKELLFNAVSLRLRSDVPVGSCLSGGLDSSSVVCLVNSILEKKSIKQLGHRQKVFTACYSDANIDESKWVEIVIKNKKAIWHRSFPNQEDFLKDIEDLVYTQDIPFADTTVYAQYRVIKSARENGIKVLLDGQGGDELFAGYPKFFPVFFAEIIRSLDFAGLINELKGLKNCPLNGRLLFCAMAGRYVLKLVPTSINRHLARLVKINGYLSLKFWNENAKRMEVVKDMLAMSLNKKLYEYMTSTNLPSLLRHEDRNSMRFSLEARTPFADDINLIEFMFKIASCYKIHNGTAKFLLRESLRDVLPVEIIRRNDKMGFATPELIWLNLIKDRLKKYINKDLMDFLNASRIYLDWNKINKNINNPKINMWRLINIALWKKVYKL